MDELNNNGKTEHAISVMKRIINKLVGRERTTNGTTAGEKGEIDEEEQQQEPLLCSLCCEIKEI